jgi:hypothetical protein
MATVPKIRPIIPVTSPKYQSTSEEIPSTIEAIACPEVP